MYVDQKSETDFLRYLMYRNGSQALLSDFMLTIQNDASITFMFLQPSIHLLGYSN